MLLVQKVGTLSEGLHVVKAEVKLGLVLIVSTAAQKDILELMSATARPGNQMVKLQVELQPEFYKPREIGAVRWSSLTALVAMVMAL